MMHRWDRLTFLHWRYDADVVQRLLPAGLTVETFDGSAWVGLVPFDDAGVAAAGPTAALALPLPRDERAHLRRRRRRHDGCVVPVARCRSSRPQ